MLRSISDLSQEATRKIASMKDPTDQARAAHELFGKSGQQLLQVLLELGLSYADAARIAQESGQIASDAAVETSDSGGKQVRPARAVHQGPGH